MYPTFSTGASIFVCLCGKVLRLLKEKKNNKRSKHTKKTYTNFKRKDPTENSGVNCCLRGNEWPVLRKGLGLKESGNSRWKSPRMTRHSQLHYDNHRDVLFQWDWLSLSCCLGVGRAGKQWRRMTWIPSTMLQVKTTSDCNKPQPQFSPLPPLLLPPPPHSPQTRRQCKDNTQC